MPKKRRCRTSNGMFADSMRLRDVINLVTSIEIPLPESTDPLDENDDYWMVLQLCPNK